MPPRSDAPGFPSAGDFDPKVGQAVLVFGARRGFICRSVHKGLQDSVCYG